MQTIDFIVFLVFTLGVVVFGCSFYKKGGSADEFTSAGHSIPGWVVGMSIFATYVSSIAYIGYPGKALPLTGMLSSFPCLSLLRVILPLSTSFRSIGIVALCLPIPSWKRNSGHGHVFTLRHVIC